jgi:hypothetical protein
MKKKGYKPRPEVPINQHAIDRVREHWPASGYMYDSDIRFVLSEQILDALNSNKYIIAPGGVFVPVNVLGEEGYAVLLEGRVKTVMPLAWCKEVENVRRKLHA